MDLIDQLQQIRMLTLWPLVVGSAAFLTARLVLQMASPMGHVSRPGVIISGLLAIVAGVLAASISRRWDGNLVYWMAFTVGLAGLAVVLLMTVAVMALEDLYDAKT